MAPKRHDRLLDRLTSPQLTKRLVGLAIPVSILEWILATSTGWIQSVPYVSHLSQLAITISLIPWYQGLRLETQQDEEDIAEDVKDKLVSETDVTGVPGGRRD